jgi:hypothetical protein
MSGHARFVMDDNCDGFLKLDFRVAGVGSVAGYLEAPLGNTILGDPRSRSLFVVRQIHRVDQRGVRLAVSRGRGGS